MTLPVAEGSWGHCWVPLLGADPSSFSEKDLLEPTFNPLSSPSQRDEEHQAQTDSLKQGGVSPPTSKQTVRLV